MKKEKMLQLIIDRSEKIIDAITFGLPIELSLQELYNDITIAKKEMLDIRNNSVKDMFKAK